MTGMVTEVAEGGAAAAAGAAFAVAGVRSYLRKGKTVKISSREERSGGRYIVDCTGDIDFPPGPLSSKGLLLFPVEAGRRHIFHPIAMAQYALGAHDLHLQGKEGPWRERFLLHADWFDAVPPASGGEFVVWKNPHPNIHYRLRTGWHSAMAQGQGISVLVRAYGLTKDWRYIDTAIKALGPFELEVGEVFGARRTLPGGIWYEEYPTLPPSFVLNGFLFALAGLLDLAPHHQQALDLFDKGLRGLEFLLPRFDTGYWSRYDLFPGFDRPADPFYHALHSGLLLAISEDAAAFGMQPPPLLREMAEKWKANGASTVCRTRALARIIIAKTRFWVAHGSRERI